MNLFTHTYTHTHNTRQCCYIDDLMRKKGLLCTRPVPGGRQMEPAKPMPGEIITESARWATANLIHSADWSSSTQTPSKFDRDVKSDKTEGVAEACKLLFTRKNRVEIMHHFPSLRFDDNEKKLFRMKHKFVLESICRSKVGGDRWKCCYHIFSDRCEESAYIELRRQI